MLLSSSLEANGPKSKTHYIVLHYNHKRQLVKLPATYADLRKEVDRLYHIGFQTFFVETKELNICAGETIRIPEEAWSDVAELLGNVYIVLEAVNHPECPPEPAISQSNPVTTTAVGPRQVERHPVYERILACDSGVTEMLQNVRNEITAGKREQSGIKWKGKQISFNQWWDTDWDFYPHSVFVLRYTFPQNSSTKLDVVFGPKSPQNSLSMAVFPSGSVHFGEEDRDGELVEYHNTTLAHSMHSVGDHSVAFIHHLGKIHVLFDFRQSTVLPSTMLIERKSNVVHLLHEGTPKCSLNLDLYKFAG